MKYRPVQISVRDLMEDVSAGLGRAHRILWEQRTEVGTLAVKAADVIIDFELTSTATLREADATLPSPAAVLGARTFSFGTLDSGTQGRSHASIKLTIVPVAFPEHRAAEPEAGPPREPVVTRPGPADKVERAQLTEGVKKLREAVPSLVSEAERKPVEARLRGIETLLADGRIIEAVIALASLAKEMGVTLTH